MSADERKAILMLIDGVNGHLPSGDLVAELALRAISAAVNVGMAVLTIGADVCENRVDVTSLAAHAAVQTEQRKTGLGVIEIGLFTNRSPLRNRVALSAGDLERTMRTFGFRGEFGFLREGDCRYLA